jgi:hypothetical protein
MVITMSSKDLPSAPSIALWMKWDGVTKVGAGAAVQEQRQRHPDTYTKGDYYGNAADEVYGATQGG